MMTEISKIDRESLSRAKSIIDAGGVVAFPTETVYGLGADARNTDAINKIFEIKGRPTDNPLIVHVHRDYDIGELVKEVPEYAEKLAKAYLPGPLTMVYRSRGVVSPAVSCGLDTLAVRIPSHKGAQEFLKFVGVPIAAPSANISKHVSPTSADHVYNDLNGKIELILDGGSCSGGIESTVLDCTGDIPVILRSGLITREMIERVAGACGEYTYREGGVARSPGMKYKHYSPACRTAFFENADEALALYNNERKKGVKAVILCDKSTFMTIGVAVEAIILGDTPEEMAANLYSKLREAEGKAEILIAIAPERRDGVMVGVMNRLMKACSKG